jgi:hypothetical protein
MSTETPGSQAGSKFHLPSHRRNRPPPCERRRQLHVHLVEPGYCDCGPAYTTGRIVPPILIETFDKSLRLRIPVPYNSRKTVGAWFTLIATGVHLFAASQFATRQWFRSSSPKNIARMPPADPCPTHPACTTTARLPRS